jgi:hypothetical protein
MTDDADASRPLRDEVQQLCEQLREVAEQVDRHVDRRLGELRRLVRQADARIADLQRAAAGDAYAPESPTPPAEADAAGESRTARVLAMAGQGLGPVEIARRLRMDVGQVELVVNLHARRPRAVGEGSGA